MAVKDVTAYGMDVSHFQTITDANAVKRNGIQFAQCKLTEGIGFVDPTGAKYCQTLQAAGIISGGYHFANNGSSATAQADYFKQRATAVLTPGHLRPMLDMESASLQLAMAVAHMEQYPEEYPLTLEGPQDNVRHLARALYSVRQSRLAVQFMFGADRESRRKYSRAMVRMARPLHVPKTSVDDSIKAVLRVSGTANAFIKSFYDRLGRDLIVYGNLTWWQTILNPGSWGNRDILGQIARYNGDPGNPGFVYGKMAIHQHTDAGVIPGITEKTDRDAVFNGYTLADLTLGGSDMTPEEFLAIEIAPVKMVDGVEYPSITVGDFFRGAVQYIAGDTADGAGTTTHPAGQYVQKILGIPKKISDLDVHTSAQLAAIAAAIKSVADAVQADLVLDQQEVAALADLAADLKALQSGVLDQTAEQNIIDGIGAKIVALLGPGWNVTTVITPNTTSNPTTEA